MIGPRRAGWLVRSLFGDRRRPTPQILDARAGAAQWAAARAQRRTAYQDRPEFDALLVRDLGGATDHLQLPWGEDADLPRGTKLRRYPAELTTVRVAFDWTTHQVTRIID